MGFNFRRRLEAVVVYDALSGSLGFRDLNEWSATHSLLSVTPGRVISDGNQSITLNLNEAK